jgi:RNA-directed DNA polymerase
MSLPTPIRLQKLQKALYIKAKQEPNYRFYLLYDKVYREDVLFHAWRLSKSKNGAPGVDGQTFEDIEEYGVGKWLGELAEEVREERYKPQAVRRVTIPKPGGVGERPLGIPTIRDRVLQTAAKLILEPIFEADFDPAAFGYRPNRSAIDAVEQVQKALRSRHPEVVDADLSKYFDTIPHPELMKCVARRISDGKMLHLLKMWLKVPVEERDDQGNRHMTGGQGSTQGTPQGGVISPLLANIYIHRFIKAFRNSDLAKKYGAVLVNYADDFVILCRSGAGEVLKQAESWLTRIGLTLNTDKTVVRNAWREEFTFLGYTFGLQYQARNGSRYLGTKPSEKAQKKMRDNIRKLLHTGNLDPLKEVVRSLNRRLIGWANYFSFGTIEKARRKMDWYVQERVRGFLRRRRKVLSRGVRAFSRETIHRGLGVVNLSGLPKRKYANA